MGEFQRMEVVLRRALFLEPRLWEAAWLLGGSLARLGRREAARRYFRQALDLLEGERSGGVFITDPTVLAWFLPSRDEARALCEAWLESH